MSERASIRGGRGGARGDRGGGRGGRGGGGGGGAGGAAGAGGAPSEKPKKENILNLEKYLDKQITVKFNGGREGYDQLMNLVLDDVKELLKDDEGNESSRPLGLIVARGTLLVLISPLDGSEEIANPFMQGDDE
ncbi:MAG: Sm-like protein lsm7 [Bathelium mastoideum]|nr:MAG: Sm-like protein lsm7 [Bathelium mastoideum]